MRLIRVDREKFLYHVGKQERLLLTAVLERYPLIPPAHQTPAMHSPAEATQTTGQLLDEVLAEHRKENRDRLTAFLQDSGRFQQTPDGWRLALSPAEREWLLQILNDVRVGSWLRLGSPEEELQDLDLDAKSAPDVMSMQMAGLFQMRLLEEPA